MSIWYKNQSHKTLRGRQEEQSSECVMQCEGETKCLRAASPPHTALTADSVWGDGCWRLDAEHSAWFCCCGGRNLLSGLCWCSTAPSTPQPQNYYTPSPPPMWTMECLVKLYHKLRSPFPAASSVLQQVSLWAHCQTDVFPGNSSPPPFPPPSPLDWCESATYRCDLQLFTDRSVLQRFRQVADRKFSAALCCS